MKRVAMKKRKPIRRQGKRAEIKAALSASAKEMYFLRHGDGHEAPCQWCGGVMSREACHIHHKYRRWKNLNEPIHVVAIHAICHAFIHEKRERENLLASETCYGVNCAHGGFVASSLRGKSPEAPF